MTILLQTQNLTKAFGGLVAVNGVSIAVEAGTTHAVIGPTGAGKTTLFKLLCGNVIPDSGRVAFEGRDITGAAPHAICRMGMGRSFQHTNIFRKLTVAGNVQAALIAHGRKAHHFWSRSEGL